MSKPEPLGGKILTKPFLVMAVFAAIALAILIGRFIFGLGATTNMNNGYPMGLWIVFDLVIGTAFACGGYALALVVYIVNKGEYHSLVRPALLTSVIGYSMGGMSVIIDLGRYWQAYTIFLPWHANLNSVMLELALCVALYTTVLWIEFSPSLMEKIKFKKGLRVMNRVLFIFIALGVLLPTMHQSSMGSMLIALGPKLSPLWQTDLLPLLFLLSALTTGFSIVIFEASLSALGFWRPLETPLLTRLSGIMRWVLAAYIIIRVTDVIARGHLGLALAGDLQGNLFLLDMALFIIPLIVLSSEKFRSDPQILFVAALSMLLAGMLYRFNAFLVGFIPPGGYNYFPSVTEILVSVGMVSIHVMAFLFFVKKFPVLSPAEKHA